MQLGSRPDARRQNVAADPKLTEVSSRFRHFFDTLHGADSKSPRNSMNFRGLGFEYGGKIGTFRKMAKNPIKSIDTGTYRPVCYKILLQNHRKNTYDPGIFQALRWWQWQAIT